MNATIPLTKKEDLKDSILYEPVKSLAPMIFPELLKKGKEPLEEIDEEEPNTEV
jgi:membrane protein required for colicin V production